MPKTLLYWKRRAATLTGGNFVLIAPVNYEREWLALTSAPKTGYCRICLTDEDPVFASLNFAPFYMVPGGSIVLSRYGDMPWQGAVYGYVIAGDPLVYIRGMETSIKPFEETGT